MTSDGGGGEPSLSLSLSAMGREGACAARHAVPVGTVAVRARARGVTRTVHRPPGHIQGPTQQHEIAERSECIGGPPLAAAETLALLLAQWSGVQIDFS